MRRGEDAFGRRGRRARAALGPVLCLGLLIGAAACSDDDDGADGGGTPTTQAPQPPTTAGTDSDGTDGASTDVGTDTDGDSGTDADGDTGTTAGGDTDTAVSDDPEVAVTDELIRRYCQAKADYDAALQESLDDPDDISLTDRVRELGGPVDEITDELATIELTPEQTRQLQQC